MMDADAELVDRIATVEEYQRLRGLVGWSIPPAAECAIALEGSRFGVVAEIEGTAVAMARLIGDGAIYAVIVDVVVTPDFQGRGLGSRLVARVTDWAQQQAIPHIAVAADDMVAGFYLRGSFEDSGTRYLRLRAPK